MTDLIEQAIWIAMNAHQGQVDKAGQPYILHVTRVMNSFIGEEYDLHRIVGVLHDVVEDTPVTLDELAQIFPMEVVDAVDAITDREGETHREYIRRLAPNRIAREVKLADIKDNSIPIRQASLPPDQAMNKAKRYAWANWYLLNYKDREEENG